MAQINMSETAGNGKITITQFQEIFRNKLARYKDYITTTMVNEKARSAYLQYQENPALYGLKSGLSFGAFLRFYISSEQGLEDNMDWETKECGGGTMAVTGTPGVAKTSIVMDTCAKMGIPCVHYTLAGLTSADIKGLPFIVRSEDVTIGVDYEQGMKLPISMLSARMAKMPVNVLRAKRNMGTPSEMRYLDEGSIFAYDKGIASEFGVLLLDEFTGTDDRGKAALQKIISQSEKGYRGLAEGSYVFPPYWLVVCAMNSSSEGGMSNGEDELDMCEFIRQRISADGFFTVYADAGTRDFMRNNPEYGEVIPTFLDWADAQQYKKDVVTSTIPGEDMGFVQYPGDDGKISSPRLWMQAARRANRVLLDKRRDEWEKSNDDGRKEALAKEIADLEAESKVKTQDGKEYNADDMFEAFLSADEVKLDTDTRRLDPYTQRLDLANSIIAARAEEMSKINKELSCAEWQAILDSVFGIPEITKRFAEFYHVHSGVYHYFSAIEDDFLAYLRGETAKSPALADLASVAKDMIALTMCCKGYILSASQKAFFALYDEFQKKVAGPIKTEDDVNELTQLVVNMYTVPLRAVRWLNDSKKFPVAVKDTIVALSKNVIDMTLQGVEFNTSANQVGGYNACVTYYLMKPLMAKSAELKMVAAKGSPLVKNAVNVLLLHRNKAGFIYFSQKNNWNFVVRKKPLKLPSNKDWAYEVEDEKDIEFLDLFLSKSSADGDAVRDLFVAGATAVN